jgi:hypothetical protein
MWCSDGGGRKKGRGIGRIVDGHIECTWWEIQGELGIGLCGGDGGGTFTCGTGICVCDGRSGACRVGDLRWEWEGRGDGEDTE